MLSFEPVGYRVEEGGARQEMSVRGAEGGDRNLINGHLELNHDEHGRSWCGVKLFGIVTKIPALLVANLTSRKNID